VELLRGSLSKGVMEIVTRRHEGLFPAPREIALSCSCPDWASMCKHVAATLYGVGARLDQQPELLFALRGVDPAEPVEAAAVQSPAGAQRKGRRVLAADQLSAVFGVDIETRPREGAGRGAGKKVAAPKRKGGSAPTRRRRTTRAAVKAGSGGGRPPRKKAKRL
jgi:hypothetical protein